MNKEQVKAQMGIVAAGRGGKGGNFQTRPNPFPQPTNNGGAPECHQVPLFCRAIDAVLGSECAIILGRTRDGGAMVLTVLDGQQRHRTYCATLEELESACTALIDSYDKY